MRVKVTPEIICLEVKREPTAIVFNKVEKLVIGNGQLRIGYRQVEKEGIQQLKLPTDKLHEVVLEFF